MDCDTQQITVDITSAPEFCVMTSNISMCHFSDIDLIERIDIGQITHDVMVEKLNRDA
jgi:hypothetical protein